MIQFILMLIALAFSNNNAHTVTDNNGQNPVTVQNDGGGAGIDPGEPGEPVGGNSGQLPPPPQPKP
ncbi:hypothetical protein [Chryseobacterium vaccae]|uniref:hypothetical protein n=1 Tax=Chryseobacterium vaccae TaxID=2604424 RepID=UPI001295BEB1|nr:hypothetical protein [Chryseobacterium vaccae]